MRNVRFARIAPFARNGRNARNARNSRNARIAAYGGLTAALQGSVHCLRTQKLIIQQKKKNIYIYILENTTAFFFTIQYLLSYVALLYNK